MEDIKTKISGKYVYAVGRRKTAAAQVRVYKNGKGDILVNGLTLDKYFPAIQLRNLILQPIQTAGLDKKIDISVLLKGGGQRGQADAVRLGVARCLVLIKKDSKASLKKEGLLTRDPRKKERKKPGLKKARRAPQWSKR